MIAIFFVGLWILIMATLIRECSVPGRCGAGLTVFLFDTDYSKIHSWLMPIFAVGLGCPRWCQMLWGVSGVALYIPWGGKAGPYL
jgi:alpha-1,3-glucan synthase